ncbi:Galactosylgalactosylxylosylprotein 3-beta-glucuronosyltransferase S [Frankliniella fusca]|uniref:Galactosylgalactosylxylosylprotein 3-beta-glucuronosyltransferase S n=1 Tax=Frankliniella fusca TaxID=407009 RepID=A0AAE1I5R8_9NEOP|nr:Galactosylgalactosylxylosylprotein 3-beta-glucuronosyltransferase S [Frankliniella fusca]
MDEDEALKAYREASQKRPGAGPSPKPKKRADRGVRLDTEAGPSSAAGPSAATGFIGVRGVADRLPTTLRPSAPEFHVYGVPLTPYMCPLPTKSNDDKGKPRQTKKKDNVAEMQSDHDLSVIVISDDDEVCILPSFILFLNVGINPTSEYFLFCVEVFNSTQSEDANLSGLIPRKYLRSPTPPTNGTLQRNLS